MLEIFPSFLYSFYSYNLSIAEQVILNIGFYFFSFTRVTELEKCQCREEKMRKEGRKSSVNIRYSSSSFRAGEKKATRKT